MNNPYVNIEVKIVPNKKAINEDIQKLKKILERIVAATGEDITIIFNHEVYYLSKNTLNKTESN